MKTSLFIVFTIVLYHYSYSQTITDSLLIEKHYRSFHFTKPTATTVQKSLVFVLHGSGGNGLQMMQETYQLETVGVKQDLITVYANGYKNFWNECRKASTAEANKIDINENLFFKKMIEYFTTNYNIDPKKVFVIGFSGGGHMAFKLAQTMPEKFGGICTIVANLPYSANNDCTTQKKPIPVMMVNGTADGVSPYNGGLMNTTGVSLGEVQSVENSFAYWAQVNGHKKKYKTSTLKTDTKDSNKVITLHYISKRKYDVILYKIMDGKHEFPKTFDVFTTAWGFFKTQMRKKVSEK